MFRPANASNRVVMALFLAIVLVVYSSRFSMAQQASPKPASPDELIEYFASLRHGLVERMMGEEAKGWLHDIIDDPEPYAEAISRSLEVEPTDQHALRRIGTALELARRSGRRDLFGPQVRELFQRITERFADVRAIVRPKTAIDDHKLRREYLDTLGLRNAVIRTLGDFGDPVAVDTCLEGLGKERQFTSGADIVMLRYLEKVAPLRPDIRPKLEEMYNSPDAPLRNNPQLLRVLKAMEKADAERRIERPAKTKQESEGKDDE